MRSVAIPLLSDDSKPAQNGSNDPRILATVSSVLVAFMPNVKHQDAIKFQSVPQLVSLIKSQLRMNATEKFDRTGSRDEEASEI